MLILGFKGLMVREGVHGEVAMKPRCTSTQASNAIATRLNIIRVKRSTALLVTFLYFAGNDTFLNAKVHDYLSVLLRNYTSPSKLSELDFNSPVPGLTSFYDL